MFWEKDQINNNEKSAIFFWLQKILFLVTVCFWLTVFTTRSHAEFREPLNGNLYLVRLAVDGHMLADNVAVYMVGGIYYINFAEFIDATEFSIERAEGKWRGWFFSEQSRFEFDPDSNLVSYNNINEVLRETLWFQEDGNLYLAMDALAVWFNMDFNLNTQQQSIALAFSKLLQFQKRENRDKKKRRYGFAGDITADAIVNDQYHLLTSPRFDVQFNQLRQRKSDVTSLSYTIGLDLFKHSMVMAGSLNRANDQGLEHSARVTFERRALNHTDDIFLGIDRYRFGDVIANNSNLVDRGGSGLGFFFERGDNLRAQTQGLVNINGDAQAGWELELYHNGSLIEFGEVNSDGRYIFTDLETFQGENRFVVKLYGPQGQLKEQIHTVWGGGSELPAGEYGFYVSHQDFSRRLFDGKLESADALPARDTSNIGFSYAITDNAQLGLGYTRANLNLVNNRGEFKQQDYYSLNGRFALGSGLFLADFISQGAEGYAWEARYLGKLFRQNLSLSHQQINNFESPYTVQQIKLVSRDSLMLSSTINALWLNSYLLRGTYERRFEGGNDLVLFNRLGFKFKVLYVTNEYEYRHRSEGEGNQLGRLSFSGRFRNHSLSGLINYRPDQSKPMDQVSAKWRWYLNNDTFNTLEITKSLQDRQVTTLSNQVTKKLGNIGVSLFNSWSSESDWAIGLKFDIAFGYDKTSKYFYTSDHGLANTGRLTMSPFLDRNNNGSRESGEPLITEFQHRNHHFEMDGEGHILLKSVPAYTPFLVRADEIYPDDPFLVSSHKIYEIDTHPGSDLKVDIPFVLTGEIAGSVYAETDSVQQGLRGLEIHLYDNRGGLVQKTRSQFDGYYSFSQVPVGEYEVRFITGGTLVRLVAVDSDEGYFWVESVVINKNK